MSSGYLFLDASDAEPKRRRERAREMYRDTMPAEDGGVLRYLDDLMRVLGNSASFGVADNVEGLANSAIYGAYPQDAHQLSRMRTEKSRDRLGPVVGTGAELAGTLGGYAATLPLMPARMVAAARGWLTPAAIPLEAARGYLDTVGSLKDRLYGAAYNLVANPSMLLNPMSGKSLAAQMFHEPGMEAAGLGPYTPSAYFTRLLGE